VNLRQELVEAGRRVSNHATTLRCPSCVRPVRGRGGPARWRDA
jgi:hypothetical protein